MTEAIFYLASSFWLGALHAATPGHGKTIAAAYIVGARGRPADALVLGIFVTLSHVSGIVMVALLASLGAAWSVPARIEAYLALIAGLLVVAIGLWMLRAQSAVLLGHAPPGEPIHPHGQPPQKITPRRIRPVGLTSRTRRRPPRPASTVTAGVRPTPTAWTPSATSVRAGRSCWGWASRGASSRIRGRWPFSWPRSRAASWCWGS